MTNGPVSFRSDSSSTDNVAVRRWHHCATVHALFPDRQDVIAFAECRFRTVAQANGVEQWQCLNMGLDCILIVKFVAQRLRLLLRKASYRYSVVSSGVTERVGG